MSATATSNRIGNEDGLRSHRMDRDTLAGTRLLIMSKYLSNLAFADAICVCETLRHHLGRRRHGSHWTRVINEANRPTCRRSYSFV
jgi:hypothetical protein